MATNKEIKKLLYSLKHSYEDKDLQESLTLLEKLINANKQETSNRIFAELDTLLGEGFYSASMGERTYKLYQHEYDALKNKHKVD